MTLCALGTAAAQPDAPPRHGGLLSSALQRDELDAAGSPLRLATETLAAAAGSLVVSVRFTNAGRGVVDSIRITSAVPPGVQYEAQSASGPGSTALFSVDGGRTFGRPEELALVVPDGASRAAGPADYTHVRFILGAPLDAGASGVVRFRAVPR